MLMAWPDFFFGSGQTYSGPLINVLVLCLCVCPQTHLDGLAWPHTKHKAHLSFILGSDMASLSGPLDEF